MRKYLSSAVAVLISAGASAQVMNGSTWIPANGSVQLATVPVSMNAVYVSAGGSRPITQIAAIASPPQNALYHQVVDRYFDAAGQEVETRSVTHVVGGDCHSGRRQQDLIVEDDGKGGAPRFVALLMGNEPAEGMKGLTAEDKVRVILAANKSLPPGVHEEAEPQLAAR